MGKWGGYHTDFAHLARGFAGNERALAQEVGEALLESGLLAEKPSVGQRHVFLNPRRAAEIRTLIDEGELPVGMRCPPREMLPVMDLDLDKVRDPGHHEALHREDARGRRDPASGAAPTTSWAPSARCCASARRRPAATPPPTSATRDDVAIIDELGTLTFREVHERTNALAHALAADGIGAGDGVGLMCRNHRGFIDAVIAISKLGANTLFLNTAFSGPQLADVAKREKPKALIYDHEFEELIHDASRRRKRYIAWHDAGGRQAGGPAARRTCRPAATRSDVDPPPERGKAIILTSGTTGTPKGASRSQPRSLDPAAALLAMIPLKAREKTMIAAPMFHSWGFVHFTLGMSLSSTLVLNRKFDPERTLALTAQHECTALIVVPVMMQRILELPDEVLKRYDLSKLRVTAVSGSALPGSISDRWMDLFGENVYNLYGSTEVAWASIATPRGPARRARAPPAARRTARSCSSTTRTASRSSRARPGASSSATRCSSRATRAAAARTSSTACSRPATSATSTRPAGCSSTAATTT